MCGLIAMLVWRVVRVAAVQSVYAMGQIFVIIMYLRAISPREDVTESPRPNFVFCIFP
jgi:hypothetical protein